MLRFQQYVELVRTKDEAKLVESIAHAKKYLLPFRESYPKEVQQACGLLAFNPDTKVTGYGVCYSLCNLLHLPNKNCRNSIVPPAGHTWPIFLRKRTTNSLIFPPYPSCTSLSLLVSRHSKPLPVILHIPPPSLPLPQPRRLRPFVLSAASNSTN